MIQAALLETQHAAPTRPRGEMGRGARLCSPALVILERFISISRPSTLACWVGYTQLTHRVLPGGSSLYMYTGKYKLSIFPFLTSHGQLFSSNSLQNLC